MRFYGFGNYYLSSLQQGLQAGHTISELFVKYNASKIEPAPREGDLRSSVNRTKMLFDWAENHKTMVLLNGGNSANLNELFTFLSNDDNQYPFAKFNEDEQSLNGALTYVGMILPNKIYEASAGIRSTEDFKYDPADMALSISDGTYQPGGVKSKRSTYVVYKNISEFDLALIHKLNTFGLAK